MERRVVVSGYVFANIVHEASKFENDTEGLLCGNIIHTTRDQITDSNSSGNQEELEYALFDIIPYERVFSFYDHLGRIVLDIKEKSDSKLLLDQTRSDGLKINIINLGHTGTHPEYRNRSCLIEPVTQSGIESGNTMTSATAIPLICDSFENTFLKEDGTVREVHHIQKMYKETMTIMKRFQENLSETEKDINKYEEDISRLRKLLRKKDMEEEAIADKRTSTNDESCRKSPDENSETMEESSARLQISQMSLEEKTSADSENQPE